MRIFCYLYCCLFLSLMADNLYSVEAVALGTEGRISIRCLNKPLQIVYNDEHPALNLRQIQTRPDGEMQNVEFAWVSNRAGNHQLKDYLRYTDGSPLNIGDQISVITAFGILPEDHDGSIHSDKAELSQPFFLYQTWLQLAVAAWLIGILLLIVLTRSKRPTAQIVTDDVALSLADHLRHLLQQAQQRTINQQDQAQIERLIYCYWQRHLGISNKSVQEAIPLMRADKHAGPALSQLDTLFHAPPQQPQLDIYTTINLDNVLAPYRNISLKELEA